MTAIQINLSLKWELKLFMTMLSRINLDDLSAVVIRHTETSQQRKAEALKRLSVVEAFREANWSLRKSS
jgi:hypothetical protein